MPHIPRRVSALTSFLALASLAAPSGAQTGITWFDRVNPAGSTWNGHAGLRALPDGSVVTATLTSFQGTGFNAPTHVVVRHVDENGNQLSSSRWPLGAPVVQPAGVVDFDVSTTGRTALLLRSGTDVSLLVLGADSTFMWSQPVPSVVPGASFEASTVGFAPGGDVLVAGIQDNHMIPPGTGRASGLRFGGAGNLLWRVDVPDFTTDATVGPGGDLFVVGTGAGYMREARRYDSSGALVWSRILPDSFVAQVTFVDVDSLGQLFIGYWRAANSTSVGSELTRLDAGGAVLWNRSSSVSDSGTIGAVAPNGDVLVSTQLFGADLTRIDSSGALLWTHTAAASSSGYASLTVGPGGNAYVGGTRPEPGTLLPVATLEAVDPLGATLWTHDLGHLHGAVSYVVGTALDPRGNVITAIGSGGAGSLAVTAKVVHGADPGVVYCGPGVGNSTGLSGRLRSIGSPAASGDNLTLLLDQLPPQSFTFLLVSPMRGLVPGAGGSQGTLCLAGPIGRYVGPGQVQSVRSSGTASLQLDLPRTPTPGGLVPVVAGQRWHFQAWYRDQNPTATSNFTNGLTVGFL